MRYGSLFSGYGGLDLGVQSVLGGSTAWFCEFDKAPSAILARHWPDVPNLGDITKVDWSTVEPVDVLTGGSPCQDLSHAGKRAGMTEGTRSNLWVQMREAVAALRPRLVVWENVRGALSAPADSDLEPCPGCVGGPDDGPVLRALGRVLGDLSELGYDSWWTSLRAADVGAAHGRFRVFLFATPADADGWGREDGAQLDRDATRPAADRDSRGLTLLPTPTANDYKGSTAGRREPGQDRSQLDAVTEGGHRWGDYAPAIARWEHVIGRPAPDPTEPGKNGNLRLSPAFVEWLMGLLAGHVTDPAIGITRNEQLKALGNGVVPQQAAAATRAFLHDHAQIGAVA